MASKDLIFVREILEKDLGYVKEKINTISENQKSMGEEIKKIREVTDKINLEDLKKNTEFREKFIWTKTALLGIGSVIGAIIGFFVMIVSFGWDFLRR